MNQMRHEYMSPFRLFSIKSCTFCDNGWEQQILLPLNDNNNNNLFHTIYFLEKNAHTQTQQDWIIIYRISILCVCRKMKRRKAKLIQVKPSQVIRQMIFHACIFPSSDFFCERWRWEEESWYPMEFNPLFSTIFWFDRRKQFEVTHCFSFSWVSGDFDSVFRYP